MKKKVLGRGLGAFFPDYDENQGTSGNQAGSGNSGSGDAGSASSGGATQTAEVGSVAGAGDSHSASSGSAGSAQSKVASAFSDPAEKVNTVLMIPVGHIRANPHQPRTEFKEEALEELAASIREHGLIQPVTVRYLGSRRFELISGERRLRASTLAGLKEIPAYIREADDEQMIAFALIENIQREELHPLEIAMGYQRLIEECGYTQQQVAERVGKNRTTVTNTIRLLQLPDFILASLRDEQITSGHARALITLKSKTDQQSALRQIVRKGLSVRQTEDLVRQMSNGAVSRNGKKPAPQNPFLQGIEKNLRRQFGTRVELKSKQKGGEIRIEYYSDEDLERILSLLHEKG